MNDEEDRRSRGGAEQDPGAEGIEHLQRAAREMLAAARSFLDAIEKVVEDRDALREVSASVTGMAATVGDALGDAVRGRSAPWVDSAFAHDDRAGARSSDRSDPPASAGDAGPDGRSERPVPDPGPASSVGADDEGADDTEEWARPLVDPQAPRRPSRVRRISVE